MFVPDDIALIGYGYGNFGDIVQDDALAPEPTFEPWVNRAIDKILLFIRYLFQERFAFFDIHMACGAGTNTAAVMIEMYIVIFCNVQNGLILKNAAHRLGWNRFIFKKKMNSSHCSFNTLLFTRYKIDCAPLNNGFDKGFATLVKNTAVPKKVSF